MLTKNISQQILFPVLQHRSIQKKANAENAKRKNVTRLIAMENVTVVAIKNVATNAKMQSATSRIARSLVARTIHHVQKKTNKKKGAIL